MPIKSNIKANNIPQPALAISFYIGDLPPINQTCYPMATAVLILRIVQVVLAVVGLYPWSLFLLFQCSVWRPRGFLLFRFQNWNSFCFA